MRHAKSMASIILTGTESRLSTVSDTDNCKVLRPVAGQAIHVHDVVLLIK